MQSITDRVLAAARRRETYDFGGEAVEVRELTNAEVAALQGGLKGLAEVDQAYELIAASVVTPDGDRVFPDRQVVAELPPRHIEPLAELAARVNGIAFGKKTPATAKKAAKKPAGKPRPRRTR